MLRGLPRCSICIGAPYSERVTAVVNVVRSHYYPLFMAATRHQGSNVGQDSNILTLDGSESCQFHLCRCLRNNVCPLCENSVAICLIKIMLLGLILIRLDFCTRCIHYSGTMALCPLVIDNACCVFSLGRSVNII